MSSKQFQILVGVLVVLAAVIAFARWNASQPASTFSPPFDASSLTPERIDKVTIASAGSVTTLTKKGTTWLVDGSAGSTETVARFWKAAPAMTFNDVVSTNASNYDSFGVGSSAPKVIFYGGKEKKAELLVGNPAEAIGSFYGRAGKEVWTISGELQSVVSIPAAGWKAKAPANR